MNNREQFEVWYLDAWGCTEDNLDSLFEESPHGNEYYRFGVRLAWQAWQQATKQSEAKYAALAAENEVLKSCVDGWCDMPATDAAIANIQAQGVDMFGQYHNFSEKLFIQKEAKKCAAQLRQEAAK